MPVIKGVAHFSIAVSDVDENTRFYTEVVGLQISVRLARQEYHLSRCWWRMCTSHQTSTTH